MAQDSEDEGPKPKPKPGPPKKEEPEADGGDIIGKQTGFNYTQRWGSKRGQTGAFHMGGRPPAKADWDVMSPEERAAVGVPDWETWSNAHEAWQGRHKVGGDIFGERTKMAEAIVGSGATTWDQVRQALLKAGFNPSIHEQGPMFKQLQMAFEGSADPSGRYHRTPGGWVDVSTSDLSKRGIPGRADYNGPGLSGMEAIFGALPQTHDIRRFQQWLNDPKANAYGLNQYKSTGPNGETMYGTGRQQYDQFGNVIDTTTGQRVGHYYPGDTRAHYGGGGTGVDWGTPVSSGGGGSGNPLSAILGDGDGAGRMPANMQELMQELARILGIQIPAEDLTPQIIPNALTPGQQPGINGTQPKANVPGYPPAPQPAQQVPAPTTASSSAQMQAPMAQPTQTAAWGTLASPAQVATPQQGTAGIFGTESPRPSSPKIPQPPALPGPQGVPQSGITPPTPPLNTAKPEQRPRRPRVLGAPQGLYGSV